MSESKRCPHCQAEIPAGTPEGLCPQCLLKEGLATSAPEAEDRTAVYSPGAVPFMPPTPAELQPLFPQFEILDLLGKGGMGAVYKARQTKLDRLVAVKILPPETKRDPAFAERFTREARAMARLHHPNIVGIHDFGQTDAYCFLVMEFVDGVNLRQAMRAGNLKAAEALKIVPQICDALQFAHDEGVVHRDIKPENILLDRKGKVKIADFGLAKLLGVSRNVNEVSLTGTQQVMGTLQYMAPEQIAGSRDVDHRADIYSLGVTFYEMLTGELPLGRFAPPSKKVEVDVRLDEVVLRSLEQEPEQRYQHASEIKTEMDHITGSPGLAAFKGGGPALEQVIADLLPDEKLAAIRAYRDATRTNVAQALSAVKAIAQKHGKEHPPFWTPEFGIRCGIGVIAWIFLGFVIAGFQGSSKDTLMFRGGGFLLAMVWAGRELAAQRRKLSWRLADVEAALAEQEEPTKPSTPGENAGGEVQVRESGTEHPAQVPAASPWGKVMRVCGALSVIAAIPLLLLGAIQLDLILKELIQQENLGDSRDVLWWYSFSAALCLAGLNLFIGGIGLLLLKRWGHRMVVGMSMIALLVLAAEAVVVLLNLIHPIRNKHIFEFVWAAIIDWFFLLAQVIVLLQDNARQLFRTSKDQPPAGTPRQPMSRGRRVAVGIGAAGWFVMSALLAMLWLPVDPSDPHGNDRFQFVRLLDRDYWPYHGSREIKVSLEPSKPIYRRLVMREKMEANYRGYLASHQAGMKYSGGNEANYATGKGTLQATKLIYTVEVEPIATSSLRENPPLVVDGLHGLSWSVERRLGKQEGAVFDAAVVAEWLERACGVDYEEIKKKSSTDAETTRTAIEKQARAIVDILHRAASNDTSGTTVSPDRQFVGRLDLAVGRYLGSIENDASRAESSMRSKFISAQSQFLNSIASKEKKQSLKEFLDLLNQSIDKAAVGDVDALEKIKNLSARVTGEVSTEAERWEAAVNAGLAQFRFQPYPFRLPWNASQTAQAETSVPILAVGVPVTLVMWLVGTWLIFRLARGRA